MNWEEKIKKATQIQAEYSKLVSPIITKIGRNQSKFHPNSGVNLQAKNFVFSGCKLAGQILDSLRLGHIQIAVVGTRTLFEMSVNAVYIFKNPKRKNDIRHMRKVCRQIIRLANKKRKVNHSRIDGTFKTRLEEIGMKHLYQGDYRIMSDWAHLMIRTIEISADPQKASKLAIETAAKTLDSLHNTFDSVASFYGFELPSTLEAEVVAYHPYNVEFGYIRPAKQG